MDSGGSKFFATDCEAQEKLQALAIVSPDEQGYEICNGLIRLHGRVWLGNNSALQTKLISAFHASAIGGHSGILPTYQRLKKLFAWTGMKVAVENFVKQCGTCQQANYDHKRPAGLLQPLPIPNGTWKELSMDFIEGLPMSHGANVIMVVVDRLSKYAHFVPLKHPFSASSVAQAFLDSVVCPCQLFQTVTRFLPAICGRSCSNLWEQNFISPPHTTRRPTGKRNE